jgi:hypothetical protein
VGIKHSYFIILFFIIITNSKIDSSVLFSIYSLYLKYILVVNNIIGAENKTSQNTLTLVIVLIDSDDNGVKVI